MNLIVGLGNVGSRYTATRHNVGFMVVDHLAATLEGAWKLEPKLQAEVATVTADSQKLVLAKPHTMMNLSGQAVQRLLQLHKLQPADVWVVFDDVDVPFGRLRIRQGGSAGGHQGVRSLIEHIGPDFVRVRIGISLNDRATEPSEVYVLKPFNEQERAQLPRLITAAGQAIQAQLQEPTVAEGTFSLL